MPSFADRLRLLRNQKGLSQADFAKQIKISKSSVNMYERGEREPSFKTLEIIADYFNVDMDYLLGKSEIVNKVQWSISTPDNLSTRSSEKSLTLSAPATEFHLEPYEEELIRKFRCLDDRGRSAVLNVLDHEFASLPGEKDHPAAKEA